MEVEDETATNVVASEKEPLTPESERTIVYENLCRKDSGIGGANGPDQQTMPTTPIEDYCSPDCDLGFPKVNWLQEERRMSSVANSANINTAVKADNLPSSDWMDQIDASDEIKLKRDEANKTRLTSAFKTTFLQIPTHYERCGPS